MTVASRSIYIEAPSDRVFAYLADVERHVEWSGELSFGLETVETVTPGVSAWPGAVLDARAAEGGLRVQVRGSSLLQGRGGGHLHCHRD
jgi:hypothetical protein